MPKAGLREYTGRFVEIVRVASMDMLRSQAFNIGGLIAADPLSSGSLNIPASAVTGEKPFSFSSMRSYTLAKASKRARPSCPLYSARNWDGELGSVYITGCNTRTAAGTHAIIRQGLGPLFIRRAQDDSLRPRKQPHYVQKIFTRTN